MVRLVTSVFDDGRPTIEVACTETLRLGVYSADVVITTLGDSRAEPQLFANLAIGVEEIAPAEGCNLPHS